MIAAIMKIDLHENDRRQLRRLFSCGKQKTVSEAVADGLRLLMNTVDKGRNLSGVPDKFKLSLKNRIADRARYKRKQAE